MSTAHTPELLPCPFCGGEATLTRGILTYVGCKKCVIAFGRHPDLKDSEDRTITEWNTRAPSLVNSAVLEALQDAYDALMLIPLAPMPSSFMTELTNSKVGPARDKARATLASATP